MFSTKLYRAAHCIATAPSPALTAQRSATQCLASTTTRHAHQRRHSSSKLAPPPDNSNSATKAAPATKAGQTSESDGQRTHARRLGRQKRAGSETEKGGRDVKERAGRESGLAKGVARKAAAKDAAVAKDAFAGVPRVEETDVDKKDFVLSSFFSLHRPLNLSQPVPQPTPDEIWSTLFQPPPVDSWANGNSAQRRPEDEIIAPQSTMRLLRSPSEQSPSLQWEVLQESPSNTKHLDQPPPPQLKSFDELVAQFQPFRAPPPPEPILAAPEKPSRRAVRAPRSSRPKVFRTTLDFTESQSADGQLSYTVTQTPLVPIQAPGFFTPTASFLQHRDGLKTYVSRLRASQRQTAQQSMREPNALRAVRRAPGVRNGVQMRLISVKRQRKLKMKKHKYKKLMKRTRNLRRRLERA